MTKFVSIDILEKALENIQQSPLSEGTVEMIVCRPGIGERSVLEQAELTTDNGMVGDNWLSRWNENKRSMDRYANMQLNLMNARAIDVIANGEKALWPLAGDQFFVDFNLSEDNLPVGTQLQIGTAVIEITAEPHLGCKKFLERFGKDAVTFVNDSELRSLKLRGVNAKVISPGVITNGGVISKLAPF
jgi:hypothetical protein